MHNIPDFLRLPSEMQEHFAKGGMIKRADGSYSRRGLWDNIRANKGSGRKPTKEMLEQEAKIRAQEQYGGLVDEYGNGGYTVRRSNARKGKTHVVIGPDGTKKYFGDPNMGERGKSKHGKEAFYARHAKNLKNNPYFRAYARATWEDGGEVPKYQDGTTSVNLAEVKISPKQYQELSADELRALHNKVGTPEGNSRSYGTIPKLIKDSIRDINAIKRLKKVTQNYNNSDIIVEPTTQYEGTDGHYYPLTPREAEQYNQYESNLPWYKNLWYNIATKDIPEGSRLANYPERNEAYLNNFPYVYQDYQDQDHLNQNYESQDTLQTPVVYKGTTYTTPFIVNPEEESNIYYTDGSHANPNRPLTNNSTQVDPKWIAKMQQQGFKNGGSYGPFYSRRDAAKLQRWRTPSADSMTPSFFAMGGLTQYQDGETVVIDPYRTPTRTFAPPASNYPAMEMDMRGSENRWANRQPLQGMQQAPLVMSTNVAPEIIETSNTPVQPVVVAQEPARPLSNVERMELMRTREVSVPFIGLRTTSSIPTSLMKKDVVKASAPLKTNDVPKTIQNYFDTYTQNLDEKDLGTYTAGSYNIVDQATKKMYVRSFDPSYKGGFKITSYPLNEDVLSQLAKIPGTTKDTDPFFTPNAGSATEINRMKLQCIDGNPTGACADIKGIRFTDDDGVITGYGHRYLIPEMNRSMDFGTLVINSNNSMEENEKKRLEVAKKNLPFTVNSLIPRSNDNEFINDPSLGNPRKVLRHYDLENLDGKVSGEEDKEYLRNNPNATYGTEDQKKIYDYEQWLAEEQNNKKRNGGRIYRSGGSIRRFDIGGNNPFDNQLTSQNQFNSTYNPYATNIWGTQQQQSASAQTIASNTFDNQINNQNTVTTTGTPYNTTVPQTANTGTGINTTTPQQSPAVASVPQNGQPFGMMPQSPAPQAPSPLTSQSLTNYLESNTPEASASRQNTEDYNYQQAMQKDFGKSMDEVDMAYKDLATAHPNYTNQELLKTLRTNYQDELNKKNTDLKNQSMKAEQARMKSIAGTLHGVDKMGQATMAGLDLFSRMNPNSYQNAVLNKNRENANPMNTMNIVGNRKGIEYSAYGGYTGLKEGVELNLSTQQIHELEKQGYKFQIL